MCLKNSVTAQGSRSGRSARRQKEISVRSPRGGMESRRPDQERGYLRDHGAPTLKSILFDARTVGEGTVHAVLFTARDDTSPGWGCLHWSEVGIDSALALSLGATRCGRGA